MKPQTVSCLFEKLAKDLKEAQSNQAIIVNILWERMNFAISALKNKTHTVKKIVEELESTLKMAREYEENFLEKQS